ncbi:unnamed protein product [Calypogeia fissa]
MSSSVDPHALNLKHQKTAPSKSDSEGASFFSLENHESFGQYAEDEIKDSQDEVSGFHQGGLQDSSYCSDPAIVDALPKDSTGDDGEHCPWGPASEVPAEQEGNGIGSTTLIPKEGLLSSTNWEGKNQSHRFSTRDSQGSVPESLGKKTSSLSFAQQLQELTGKTVESNALPFQRFRNSESSIEPRGIPLARRLQELVQQAQDAAPSTCLPHQQFRVQELTGQTGDSDAYERARFQNSELSLETRGIPLALRLQELVQQSPAAGPSNLLPHPQLTGNKLEGRQHTHGKNSASSTIRDRSAIEDDIVEHCDSSGHLQTKSPKKRALVVPVNPTSSIWERFEEALDLDSPDDTNPASTDRLNSNEALSGFSKLLQNTLKELKNEQIQFQKLLTSSQSLRGVSRCLEVLILRKYLEGQLITCHCEVLQSPPEWNDPNHAAVTPVDSTDNLTIVEVLFSSKMSGDLELEVGRVVRIHPPWQEILGAGQFEKIILGTFFCEMVE